MKKAAKVIKLILICVIYILTGVTIAFFVSKSGMYPSGSDAMSYLYKSDTLYKQIMNGNWYPLFDAMMYNGIEPLRYTAPLPLYFLALCEGVMGGSCFQGYLLFIVLAYVGTALSWLVIGVRHRRPWMGAFIGLIWFFMPNNLYALFAEGNLARALVMIILPLLVSYVHDYLLDNRWRLPHIIGCFLILTLCEARYTVMIGIGLLLFLLVYTLIYRQRGKIFRVMGAAVLGIFLSGIWLVASLKGSNLNAYSTESMKRFFQNIWVTINPVLRITDAGNYFYFGMAAVLLIVFGCFFARRKSMPGFWSAILILLSTSAGMYSVIEKVPGNKYLWMLMYISIALCFALYSLFLWDSLRKPFLYLLAFLLVLDTVPSLSLISGNLKNMSPEKRYELMDDTTLIGEAREITVQRMALFDLSTLGADGAYLVSGGKDGVENVFGSDWQSAVTAENDARLNEALEQGAYLYLFDRCIEMGSDTVVVKVSQAYQGNDDISAIDAAAARLDYNVTDYNSDYRLYHMDVDGNFGVISKYSAIGIGKSASLMALNFPDMEETTDTNLNHYTYDDLKQYDTIYLAGFTYDDRSKAENMILRLTREGTRVVVLADGIPVDKSNGLQIFAGVTCQKISFSNGFPQLDTTIGILNPNLFPEGHTEWSTVYMNGLDDSWGTTTDLNRKLDFIGTKDNENLVFVGFNLTYHYALTHDERVGELVGLALGSESGDLPERQIVPITVTYGRNEITIDASSDDVNTTIASHDNYDSSQTIHEKNNLTYVKAGRTIIKMRYPYLYEGLAVSGISLVVSIIFLILTRRGEKKKIKNSLS